MKNIIVSSIWTGLMCFISVFVFDEEPSFIEILILMGVAMIYSGRADD